MRRLLLVLFLVVSVAPHVRAGSCFLYESLDGKISWADDPVECAIPTSPASTFKIPHALIALDTGVVTDPLATVPWDGTKQAYPTWERDHSLDSAIKWSVLPFFRRTASLIGRERMTASLKKLRYGSDTFEQELTSFWVNGDLVISPQEQLDFLRRMMRYELPVRREHVDAVKAALRMPPGKITNASGTHDFALNASVVRAKTGRTRVGEERVNWVVGQFETAGREYVFVSRVRDRKDIPVTAATDHMLQRLRARLTDEGRR
jgi:beta-lactamase class D